MHASAASLDDASPTTTPTTTPTSPKDPVNTEPNGALNLAEELLSSEGLLGPLGNFKVVPMANRTPRVKGSAVEKLSDTTKRVLGDRNINRTDHSVNSTLSSHNARGSPC